MSDQTPHGGKSPDAKHDPKAVHHARPTHVRSGDNHVGKWLAGAAVAALVLGGGYYAVTNMPAPTNEPMEVASYQSKSSDVAPYAAGPMNTDTSTADLTTAPSAIASESGAASSTTSTRSRARTVQTAQVDVVPETVIGVAPSSVANDADEVVVTGARRPVWVSTPTARRLSAMYPARALEREREGEASLRCIVQDGGSLACERVSETPTRAGFGNAALRVARTFKHAPTRYDGASATGTPVNLRVMFRITDEDQRRT